MKVTIVGSGVVGRATGMGFSLFGHEVVFHDISLEPLNKLSKAGYQTSPELVSSEAFMVCVPSEDSDIRHVKAAMKAVSAIAEAGSAVVLRSTVPVGTTRSLAPLFRPGVTLLYQPEYLRAAGGREPLWDFLSPKVILVGELSPGDGARLASLYRERVACPVWTVPAETAEFAKLAHNATNAAKISWFNEIHALGSALGVDANLVNRIVSESAESMTNPQYGTMGGRPYGGECLPKDLAILLEVAEKAGVEARMLKAAGDINKALGGR